MRVSDAVKLLILSFVLTITLLGCMWVYVIPAFPAQPEIGPGSAVYLHADVTQEKYGRGATAYHVFEPVDPKPISAPVIVFMHGLFGTSPSFYMGWINHIARKGNIVVFPVYQSMMSGVSSRRFAKNTIKAIKASFDVMTITPELNHFAMVGHSAGALLTANLAATAAEEGLPSIRAAMCVAPGITPIFKLEDMTKIPANTLLITISGDRDMLVGDKDAKKVFNKAIQVVNRNYIHVRSDRGNSANHFAALTSQRGGNNIDYYCYWKIFEALCDAAFYNTNWEYCLGDTSEQRYMGTVRKGKPMKELEVTLPNVIFSSMGK